MSMAVDCPKGLACVPLGDGKTKGMPGLNQLACLPTEPRNKAKKADGEEN